MLKKYFMANFKILFILLFMFAWISLFAQEKQKSSKNQTPVEKHGQLSVEGNLIVDENGYPVQLCGMSFFWSQWIYKYYNPKVVKWLIDDWRCEIIRIPLGVEPDGYLVNKKKEMRKVEKMIKASIAEGIYVIVDWHDHRAENHLQEAREFFSEIAQKYGSYPNIIYEIYNEPLKVSWEKVIKPYHEEIIEVIRKYDPDNIIACGTAEWAQRVDEPVSDPLDDRNVVYTLHFYAATHKQWLRNRAREALNSGIPLMVTEFGTSNSSAQGEIDEVEMHEWWKFMDEYKLSWCNWSVADKEETTSVLKPGASRKGKWKEKDLTPSGIMVREKLREKNPPVEKK
jgi:endoglucanase